MTHAKAYIQASKGRGDVTKRDPRVAGVPSEADQQAAPPPAIAKEPPTPTIFRRWPDGKILALFPMDDENGYCSSYMHVGQHSEADYWMCVSATKPATPAEYADLKAELESIGYNVKVCKRRQK